MADFRYNRGAGRADPPTGTQSRGEMDKPILEMPNFAAEAPLIEDQPLPGNPPLADDFAELMQRVAQGDEAAFRLVAERYTPHILRVVRSNLPPIMRRRFDSQDFAQTVWRVISRERSRLQQFEQPGQLINFLMVSARNRVISERRKQLGTAARNPKREIQIQLVDREDPTTLSPETLADPRGDTPSRIAIRRETFQGVTGGLSERDRRMLELSAKGLTCEEIATELNVVARTVRRFLSSVRDQIRGETG